ncbi:branched-chain amino acid ABC transporter permease [Acuticoccus sediminis]|uniref:Branched-chain amino acid ABC transporter permease n=1 Tax=Acuticoccus sediminis TaxID=2184697 RepID=A0A8B2NTM7_9HYPH|nr:branched-chain amino acid ABC transporter permease [Acuticoccus sediminis]RAI03547.1 branched-chain amino acid ABC transporter permease [Acuticoccus sediminis]
MSNPVRIGLFAIWIVVLGSVPFWGDNAMARTAIMLAMSSVLAYSWNIIGGFAGYPSFSTAAFFGLGSYVGALCQGAGVPMPLAWLAATIFVAAFAGLIGGIVLRLRGHYFAIASIAIVEVCRLVVAAWGSLTGGGNGLNVPLLMWSPDNTILFFLMVMLALLVIIFAITVFIDRHRFGFALKCIRQNEDAADMVGVDATRFKILAYVLSAFLCGTAGAVYASWIGYIDPTDSFQIVMTVEIPVMAMLGGAGTVLGPAIGAAAFVVLEEIFWANFLDWNRAILGAIIVVVIFALPGGLIRIFSGRTRLPFLRSRSTEAVQ